MASNDDLLHRIERLERETQSLEGEIQAFKEEERQRELRRLRWGVTALGSVVVALGGWAWTQVSQYVTLTIGPR